MDVFRTAIEELDPWLKDYAKNNGIVLVPIPVPPSIETVENRFLVVAWGLSHRRPDVGKIIPADRIPDVIQ